MSLEKKLAQLDSYAEQIEGDLTLAQSLEIFEKSVNLAKECMQSLNDCKGKLIILQDEVKKITDEK